MKTLILSFIILLSLTSVSAVSSGAIGGAAAAGGAQRQQEEYNRMSAGNGCVPPIEFATEHGCELKYYPGGYVNRYRCGEYYSIYANCDGSVIESKIYKVRVYGTTREDVIVNWTMGITAVIVAIISAIAILRRIRK